jgi:hypothetical protein
MYINTILNSNVYTAQYYILAISGTLAQIAGIWALIKAISIGMGGPV